MPPRYSGPGVVLGWTEPVYSAGRIIGYSRIEQRGTVAGLTEALRTALDDVLNEQMPIGVVWPPAPVLEAAVASIVEATRPTVPGAVTSISSAVEVTPDAFEVVLGEGLL